MPTIATGLGRLSFKHPVTDSHACKYHTLKCGRESNGVQRGLGIGFQQIFIETNGLKNLDNFWLERFWFLSTGVPECLIIATVFKKLISCGNIIFEKDRCQFLMHHVKTLLFHCYQCVYIFNIKLFLIFFNWIKMICFK